MSTLPLAALFSNVIVYGEASQDLSGYETEDDSNIPNFTVVAPPRSTPADDPFESPLIAAIKKLAAETHSARRSRGSIIPVALGGHSSMISDSEIIFNPPLFSSYTDTIKAAKEMCLPLQHKGFSGKVTIKNYALGWNVPLKISKIRKCKSAYSRKNNQ